MTTTSYSRRIVRLCLTLGLVVSTGHSQIPSSNLEEEDVVEMNPFFVGEDADVGYLATNTMSGTRLNTSLRDTPATVHVFTKEFLEDIGAVTLEDVMAYATNAVKDDDEEGFFIGGSTGADLNFRPRVRGLPATRARNFFRWQFPSDGYITERYDESRGPNGTLFGLSGAGGVVNQSTKKARLSRDFNTAQFMVGSYSLARGTLDVNKVLIKDKLALRFSGMKHNEEGWRQYNWERKEGLYGTMTYRPFENTTVQVSVERFRKDDSVTGNIATSLKTIDTWDSLGRPSFDLVNSAAPRNPVLFSNGLQRNNANNFRVTLFDKDAGALANQAFDLRGFVYTRNRIPNGNRTKVWDFVYPQDEIPGTVAIEGPGTSRHLDYDDLVVEVNHKLADDLYLQLGFNRTDSNWESYGLRGTTVLTPGNGSIQGDANSTLPDGSPNPFAGSLFVDSASRVPINEKLIETYRAAVSYELDFKKKLSGWAENLGRHRFAVAYENYNEDADGRILSEMWLDAATGAPAYFPAKPDHVRNRVFHRHYITNEADFSDYHNRFLTYQPTTVTDPNDPSRQIVSAFQMDMFTPADLEQSLDSTVMVMQNYFWGGRVVTTAGWRDEDGSTKKFNYMLNDLKNEYIPIGSHDFIYDEYSGGNKSVGGVFHATRWLSLTYNTASNIDIPRNDIRVIPGEFPDPGSGKGKDIGVNLRLFDGKIALKALRYETTGQRITASYGAPAFIYAKNEVIIDGLVSGGFIDAATEAEHRLADRINAVYLDKESVGYEFSMTANLKPNWSLLLNFSTTDKEQANVGNAAKVWAAEESAFWLSSLGSTDPDSVILSNNRSVLNEIERLDDWIAQRLRPGTPVGLRKYKANFFTNYTFREGALKGFAIGGGYRYTGKNLMAYLADDSELYGEDYGVADMMMRYRAKLGDKRTLTFQVNIRNLFNKDDFIPARYLEDDPTNPFNRAYLMEPRSFQFTTTLAF